ncbi:MAG: outer membrane lipoprotein-sorting protein [Kiritimatiellae bacterium]|jgi:outer membrane lipoprotein-sorting protein|nr:outer membrane lipoprotein-sorting protein [Kiritimatiellia bacterium]
MRRIIVAMMMAAIVGMTASVHAAELTVDEIVAKANDVSYYAGDDGRAEVSMKLSDGRSRDFVILRKDVPGGLDQMFYVYFKDPSDVRKMSFLVHKRPAESDDRWLFLPALNLVKRIAPGDKRTSFVGSDFLYEDVSGRGLQEDKHELFETTDSQYIVKNVPKTPSSVEFSSYKVWIDKDTFMPRKAEYFDKNQKLYRRILSNKIKVIQNYPTALEQVVEDVARGTSTTSNFSKVEYDVGLNDRIFTERFLRRPPREVTQ